MSIIIGSPNCRALGSWCPPADRPTVSTDAPVQCPAQVAGGHSSADRNLPWCQKIILGTCTLPLQGREPQVQSREDTCLWAPRGTATPDQSPEPPEARPPSPWGQPAMPCWLGPCRCLGSCPACPPSSKVCYLGAGVSLRVHVQLSQRHGPLKTRSRVGPDCAPCSWGTSGWMPLLISIPARRR